jgi:hypothetical protein
MLAASALSGKNYLTFLKFSTLPKVDVPCPNVTGFGQPDDKQKRRCKNIGYYRAKLQ